MRPSASELGLAIELDVDVLVMELDDVASVTLELGSVVQLTMHHG